MDKNVRKYIYFLFSVCFVLGEKKCWLSISFFLFFSSFYYIEFFKYLLKNLKPKTFYLEISFLSILYGFKLVNPLPPSDAVRQQKKNIFEDLFSSVSSQFKKYHPCENLKFYNLGILKSLKLRILVKKSFQFLLS